ncbi:hypothetical protein EST38_g4004 [Candolleomyces aberdarensis]|uniref:Calpain catalytic domain-containing protein n=1 Tax=Candolleomyces aberdarensis TaxID=2316362 RepID=A0A4Q2DP66_9AGAR|nr:hypothetical protein EST38_g4004 [Candolleomyces aberdarensis]
MVGDLAGVPMEWDGGLRGAPAQTGEPSKNGEHPRTRSQLRSGRNPRTKAKDHKDDTKDNKGSAQDIQDKLKERKKSKPGLFVTKELAIAIEKTKATVEQIAKECRMRNTKFRDAEFDLEKDETLCLHGYTNSKDLGKSKDVQRITEIFDEPAFFPPGGAAHSAAIKQGNLGDCYFLSALATVSGPPGLIEKICVARDEKVGVYGFIFYQDQGWLIGSSLLYTNIPQYESLNEDAKAVYHEDKDRFNAIARKGGQLLLYAKAGTSNETWVPLIEKAYAKLYGCFSHLVGGQTREAIEDLTGGVASHVVDILDVDAFWKDELCRVNKDRLFACSFRPLPAASGSADDAPDVQGLVGAHAYAILRVAEINGKRFVVLRNPWGRYEWTGPWADGSKEWTPEWVKILPQLQHSFANDGQFVMEFIVNIPKKTKAIFALSTLNSRAFRTLPKEFWIRSFEFSIVKVGELKPLVTCSLTQAYTRSASLELEVQAGKYIIYVKIDQWRELDPNKVYSDWKIPQRTYPTLETSDCRRISKILTSRVKAMSLAENWDGVGETDYVPKSLQEIIKEDLEEINKAASLRSGGDSKVMDEDEDEDEDDSDESDAEAPSAVGAADRTDEGTTSGEAPTPVSDKDGKDDDHPLNEVSPVEWIDILENADNAQVFGLRVYTRTREPAEITGRIKCADKTW